MSIEVRPLGVKCNIMCDYCYEENSRAFEQPSFDYAAVAAAVAKLPGPNQGGAAFSLFGGEPLLVGPVNVEKLLKLAYDKWGSSGIQTNGTLITEDYIEMFRKYNTHVGISIDGPGELNGARRSVSDTATLKTTNQTLWAIRRLCEEAETSPHLRPSIIVTLHAGNCAADRFPILVAWFRELEAMGVRYANLHVLEMDHKAGDWFLPSEEMTARLIDLWRLQDSFTTLKFLKFEEIMKLMSGNDDVVCVWHTCDPWNTSAVNGIEGDGSPSHCSRTNKDGTNWLPAEGAGETGSHTTFIGHPGARHYERQLGLFVSPQEVGGCQGCPFWLMCFGNCPGTGALHDTGASADWRYRTSYCHTYKQLFREGEARLESQGVVPFSKRPDREAIEKLHMEKYLMHGQSCSLKRVIAEYEQSQRPAQSRPPLAMHGDAHGDHYDAHGDTQHGDAHGDTPHGDAHGDK